MAGDHRENTPDPGGRPPGQHAPMSRRAVLRGAAGASAAGLVAGGALTAAVPAMAAARPDRSGRPAGRPGRSAASTTPATAAGPDRAEGPLVIHVRDARTGEMDIFAGTTRTRLVDPALAARLARASR
jgi:hypothetical protein